MRIKNWERRRPLMREMWNKNWAKKRTNNWKNEDKELGKERSIIGEMRIKNWTKKRNNWRNEGEHWKGRGPNIGEMRIKNWAKKRIRKWRKEDKEL
jgi:hypothetical protein